MKTLTAWQTDPGRGEREQEDIGLLINSGQNYNIKKGHIKFNIHKIII